MWRHPNYYRDLEKERKKLEQQLKRKGEKDEQQASSDKRPETEQEGHEDS